VSQLFFVLLSSGYGGSSLGFLPIFPGFFLFHRASQKGLKENHGGETGTLANIDLVPADASG